MDTVNVNGTSYEKASLLAKEFKYTSDYLGQLCRAKKVDSQLIGRTWYINRDSLAGHKTSRYSKSNTLPNEKTFEYNVKINKSRIEVEPFVKNTVVKMVDSKAKHFSNRISWKPVKYEVDKGELLPTMANKSKKINVDLAEAKKIRVEGVNLKTEMQAEDLPEVVLKGDIKISSLDFEYDLETDVLDKKNIDFLAGVEDEKISTQSNYLIKESENKKPVANDVTRFSLIPKKVKQNEKEKEGLKLKKWLSFVLITTLTVTLLLLLFVEFKIEASAQGYEVHFEFSPLTYDQFLFKI